MCRRFQLNFVFETAGLSLTPIIGKAGLSSPFRMCSIFCDNLFYYHGALSVNVPESEQIIIYLQCQQQLNLISNHLVMKSCSSLLPISYICYMNVFVLCYAMLACTTRLRILCCLKCQRSSTSSQYAQD